MPLRRLSNSHSNDYSWVEIGVKTIEISRKLWKPHLLTSCSHNFWSDRWSFEFHTFLETKNEYLSKGVKISPIRWLLRPGALEEPLTALQGHTFFWNLPFCLVSLNVFSLFQTPKKKKKKIQKKSKKHIKVSWFFSLHQKHKVLFLYPIFFSLVPCFGFGVKGCGCSFFGYHPHP